MSSGSCTFISQNDSSQLFQSERGGSFNLDLKRNKKNNFFFNDPTDIVFIL